MLGIEGGKQSSLLSGVLLPTRVESFMKGQQGHAVTRAIKYCYLYKCTSTSTSIKGHLDKQNDSQVKALAVKPDDLSSLSRTHVVVGEN